MTLSSRIEAASGDQQRELLWEGWQSVMMPELCGDDESSQRSLYAHQCRFLRLLDAEAYIDAALTLVPEGWEATIWTKGEAYLHSPDRHKQRDVGGFAATPALALAAAATKIKESERADNG